MSFSERSDAALHDQATVHYYPVDEEGGESLVTRLVCALAEIEGRSPESFDSGLRGLVDLDALERLFEPSTGATGQVILDLHGTEVRICADGSFFLVT